MSVFKFLRWALILVLLAAGAAAWWTELLGKRYTATAQVQVGRVPPHVLSGSDEKFDQAEFEDYRDTQMQLIKSRFVLMAALRDPKVKYQPSVVREETSENMRLNG